MLILLANIHIVYWLILCVNVTSYGVPKLNIICGVSQWDWNLNQWTQWGRLPSPVWMGIVRQRKEEFTPFSALLIERGYLILSSLDLHIADCGTSGLHDRVSQFLIFVLSLSLSTLLRPTPLLVLFLWRPLTNTHNVYYLPGPILNAWSNSIFWIPPKQ